MRQSRPTRRRGALAALVCGGMLLSVAACSTDTVAPGERPNKPTSSQTPPASQETDPAKLSIDLSSMPGFVPATVKGNGRYERPMTDEPGNFWWQVFNQDDKVIEQYQPKEKVAFGDPSTYTDVPGVLTFRGNNYRNGGAYGKADVKEKKLEIAWEKPIGEIRGEGSYWPGAGWTGQPLLVHWPEATRQAMGLPAKFANDPNFTEVIYPVFEGKVYRLDLATGESTKDPIDVKFGFKGTGSIDPRGYPLLYSGQGLNDRNGTIGPWRYRFFDLIQNKEVWGIPGLDASSLRHEWGAFDSSALVNRQTDTLIEPAENGLIYKVKLNSRFDPAAKKVSINPELVKLAYAGPQSEKHGIENSAVAYRNLMFADDNDGNLFCWDATTMQILWMRNTGDDVDSTMVLEETPDGVFLYTGNEVDNRGATGGERISNIRKIDALTGRQVWQHDIPAYYDPAVNGGVLGTPAIGQGSLSDMVIFNVARTTAPREGDMLALDKKTGQVIWRRHMTNYSWSSPTIFQATDGNQYGIVTDSDGIMHLFDPQTGEDLSTISLGKNTEASPSIYNNMIVVASYDKKIFGIKIK
ncbi:outer membrane protein assembly factor BamB family protein [Nigerium massiliense]|uniref:outer membrane protein assembly factor BamB family protein n=1 Tax=Nigerium massiliense TaxID=1522317 RepID=UPI000694D70A|nr:PQQ-binding-like beta-propeller repeat protein [Nigerium massiliense]